MINITDPKARQAYQVEFDRNMTVVERVFFNELRPILGRQFINAAQIIASGDTNRQASDHAVDLGRKRLLAALLKHYTRCARVFSKKTYKVFAQSKLISVPEIKEPEDEFWSYINRWGVTQAAFKVRTVQETTKKVIASIILKGMQEGESHKEIGKRIMATSSKLNLYRANRIARTETHTAAVKAVNTAVASTRIEMEREWVSALDERTRSRANGSKFEHFASAPNGPNGERVAQDGKYVNTGESLDYPGDPKGSAGNIVHCRCVEIFHTVKRTENIKPYEPE